MEPKYKIVGDRGGSSTVTWQDDYQDATWAAFELRLEGWKTSIYRTADGKLLQ